MRVVQTAPTPAGRAAPAGEVAPTGHTCLPPVGWRTILLAFAIVYLVDSPLRRYLNAVSLEAWLQYYETTHLRLLTCTFLLYTLAMAAGSYGLLRRFYGSVQPTRTVAIILGTALAGIALRAGLEEGLLKAVTGEGNYHESISWGYYFRDNMLYALTYVGLGTVTFFVQHARQLEARQLASEAAMRQAQLDYLRAQVNPHFLFNTLNSVYALVYAKSERALAVVERLSALLRYALYEEAIRVPLVREVEQMSNLMALEEVRLVDARVPALSVTPEAEAVLLPPLLLLPFVENMYKHGEMTGAGATEARIDISVDAAGDLRCVFENTVRAAAPAQAKPAGGIGIDNVRQRLELLYPDTYGLKIEATGSTYRVSLQIPTDA